MNKDQAKGHSSEEKEKGKDAAGKGSGDKSTAHKADRQGGKEGSVLRDINGGAKT